jgi:amino acid adenylation domain-containing protein
VNHTSQSQRTFDLSRNKRALLKALLQEEGVVPSSSHEIPRRKPGETVSLSFAQQRLWFLDQLEPNSALYNITKAVRVSGFLNVEALQKTFDAVVARHEVLRTNFADVDGVPVQIIAEGWPVALRVTDLSQMSASEREAGVQRLLKEEASRPFNLSSDLMLRATLLKLESEEHILLLVMHHIVSDGWSMGILFGEISALYEAFSTGKPSSLAELPIQYADYAIWQRRWLQGAVLESRLSYWRQQLKDAPHLLELPADRPRLAVQSYRGARQSFLLPKALSEALKTLSRQEAATLFMTLLAAFKTLLHRHTGRDDIVVGSPIAGRSRVETEGLVGFFVNNLVLRTDLAGDPSFREMLGRVRETALGADGHQGLPFEKLVEELQPERALSYNPLFQVMFAFQNFPTQSVKLPGLTASPVKFQNDTAKFDLTLAMVEKEGKLGGSFEYSTDLFDETTIKRMIGHFQTLLEGVVANPDQRLSDLPILTKAERHQLLVEWNDTKREYPKNKCIHELFETQVERSPDAVAVVFEDKTLTYRELSRRANQLAHYLKQRGVGPQVLVGLCVERSLEMTVGILGILKAGGAYVPLEPRSPKERLAFMLEDAEVSILLTHKRLSEDLPRRGMQVIYLDTDWKAIAEQSEENPHHEATSDNLAYMIYTSGSTGKPKGVLITHRNLVHSTSARVSYYAGPVENFLLIPSFVFDSSVAGIFWTLCQGGTLVLAQPGAERDASQMAALIETRRISHLLCLPSLYALLLAQAKPGQLVSLKTVIVAGEACELGIAERHQELLPQTSLFNEYGPTEGTVWSTVYPYTNAEHKSRQFPIGAPISNCQIYVLDAYMQPVPIGVPGEIFIGGAGLARGYLNRPELTAEKFIPDPFSDEPGARLYKTGDLARYLPDGNIEFLGRVDHQVKIRGFRIELGEIEAVLSQHPTVREAVVVSREDLPGEKRLVAYVVPPQEPAPSTSELRGFLQQKLPDYMIPSVFVFLESLPLTPNGKVDRERLPVPNPIGHDNGRMFLAPRDNVEYRLAKIWEDILGVRPVGVNDNFFELGGHSLLAVRLLARVEKEFNRSVPLAALFAGPTIDKLADLVRHGGEALKWNWLLPIQPAGSKPPLFLLHGSGELGRQLGMDQPVYGGRTHGLDGRRSPLSVEEMAANYVKEIRMAQPEGPYFVGGYCFGGLLAFEVARQLRERDQEVALLILLDPTTPGKGAAGFAVSSSLPQAAIIRLAEQVRRHSRKLWPLRVQERLTRVGRGVQWRFDSVRTRLARRVDRGIKMLACRVFLGFGQLVPEALRMFYFMEVSRRAARNYVPKVYSGRVVLLRTENAVENSSVEWERLVAGKLEIYDLPGEHHMDPIQGPYVQAWAERMRACLQNAPTNVSYDSSTGSNS